MDPRIALITILTDDVPRLVAFYRDVLGFEVADDVQSYVEFRSEGVRICRGTSALRSSPIPTATSTRFSRICKRVAQAGPRLRSPVEAGCWSA